MVVTMKLDYVKERFRKIVNTVKGLKNGDETIAQLANAMIELVESLQDLRMEVVKLRRDYDDDKRKWALEAQVKKIKNHVDRLETELRNIKSN